MELQHGRVIVRGVDSANGKCVQGRATDCNRIAVRTRHLRQYSNPIQTEQFDIVQSVIGLQLLFEHINNKELNYY